MPKRVCSLLCLIFAVKTLHAAPITWEIGDIDGANGLGDLSVSTLGTGVEAANFGGPQTTVNSVTFSGIDFEDSGTLTNLDGLNYDENLSGNGASGLGDIDTLLDTIGFKRRDGNHSTTLTGLIVGNVYQVQFFLSFGTNRTYSFDDLEDNFVSLRPNNPAQFVTGIFLADATTQAITMISSEGSHVLNGYQLRDLTAVPGIITQVTTLEDELDPTESPSNETSLREALRNTLPNGIITFASDLNGGTIQLDATLGQLHIDKSVRIDASSLADGIIIDGGSDGDFVEDSNETRCFLISDDIQDTKNAVFLENLTIQKGVFDGLDAGANISNRENLTLIDCQIFDGRSFSERGGASGAGLFTRNGNVTMHQCLVSGNKSRDSEADGGGIYNENGTLSLFSCTVSDNEAFGSFTSGGGIYCQDGEVFLTSCLILRNKTQGNFTGGGGLGNLRGTLELTGCTISENQTDALGNRTSGGGIESELGEVIMIDCIVSKNKIIGQGSEGCGIATFADDVTLTRCVISENLAEDPDFDGGGGIDHFRGSLTMTDCSIFGHQVTGESAQGAGVRQAAGSLTMIRCLVSENRIEGSNARGAGVYVDNGSNSQSSLTRCTIAENHALGAEGGGVFNFDGPLLVDHCTISANTAGLDRGAGVVSRGNDSTFTTISNSIVQGNGGELDVALFDGTTNSFTFSGSVLIGTAGTGVTGLTLNAESALLAPLANYGGLTDTMPPIFDSPAINAAATSNSLEDQRGFPIVGLPDIGAAEVQGEEEQLELAFTTDADHDGLVFALERAIGTDPEVPSFSDSKLLNLRRDATDRSVLTFGRGSNPIPGTEIILQRSTTLQTGSFVDLFNFDFNGETSTGIITITVNIEDDQFTIRERNEFNGNPLPLLPTAFYRLSVRKASNTIGTF